jgi:hypothetical protein
MRRIQDTINRRTVVNFVETVRIRSKFRAHMSRKHSARMTGIPQIDVPEILVEDEEERAEREASATRPRISREITSETTVVTSPTGDHSNNNNNNITNNPFLSAAEAAQWQNPFLSAADTANAQHAQHHSWSGAPTDLSAFDSFYGRDGGVVGGPSQAGGGGHRNQASAFSFELHEPGGAGGSSSNRSSRRGSGAVRPEQVTEMLDSSVWMDSIRRSATLRRPGQGRGGSEGAWEWQ